MFRFRSFRARLLTFILALAGFSQLAALLLVERINHAQVVAQIRDQLRRDAAQFDDQVRWRNEALTQRGEALSFDVGMREAISRPDTSAQTFRSALQSLKRRSRADLAALLTEDGSVRADTRPGAALADAVYRPLFEVAERSGQARASGYGVIDGELYSLTVVPVRAPHVVGWIVIGFRLDKAFFNELLRGGDLLVALVHQGRTLAAMRSVAGPLVSVSLDLEVAGSPPAVMTLAYSLDQKLEPVRRLEALLMAVGGGTLVFAGLLALLIARNVGHPVRRLAAHTEVIARGDYAARLELDRADELGRLAQSFNAMSAGLAERDQIRDLLDKNVSPEVAAQLMREGAALGGEEREATILFADLRGFTTLSEGTEPQALVALLNRYLDRMSAEIERQGGVIDKFIGDEIMALFSAPVTQQDASDRALRAALGMTSALEALNRELAAENRPPLAVGIGINTARVVAGNIGSHRRLNYSVIGDGVNIASRLQSLTRVKDYQATIIVSDATRRAAAGRFRFRALGAASVKGREGEITVHALEGEEDTSQA